MAIVEKPVILVHGLWNTVNVFWKLRAFLEAQGWTVYGTNLTPNNGDVGIETLAEQTQAFILNTLGNEQPFDLVGFSMGGLVSRYYLQKLGGWQRVQRLVTVATPHYGSLMAHVRWNVGGRQMRPGSDFLRDLNHDLQQLQRLQVTTLWTPFDLLVVPVANCQLSCGDSIRVLASNHHRMISHPQSLSAIAQALNKPCP